MPLLFVFLLFVFLGLLTYYFFLLRQRYRYFKERNIPTPRFQFLFGHLKTFWGTSFFHRQLESWTKRYGKIYGLYEGSVPMFVVSNPDFLQEVFVKQFAVFTARKATLLDRVSSDLIFSSGQTWRRQRYSINPAFTAAKLKAMNPLINGCISDFMRQLPNHVDKGEEFNIYLYYKRMAMDIICRCAFGIDTDLQNNPENIYFKKMVELLDDNVFENGFLIKAAQVVPEIGVVLAPIFSAISNTIAFVNTRLLPLISSTIQLKEIPIMWLLNRLHTIVKQRQQTPISRIDLLQLMLEVTTNDTTKHTGNGKKTEYRLTNDEVISNIFIFMAAGFETTSTALAYATYELARNPHILRKLQTEVDELLLSSDGNDEEGMKYPDYDVVAAMPYMDLFISEVLRFYPIANRVIQRRATEDTVVQGIQIKKGSVVYPDIYSIHFDQELWGPDDPYLFLPERHQQKRHPMAYMPFGAGPRQCIGMRFALIEMKILLIRMLRDYDILPGENLEDKFIIQEASAIAPDEVWIKLVKRQV